MGWLGFWIGLGIVGGCMYIAESLKDFGYTIKEGMMNARIEIDLIEMVETDEDDVKLDS